MLGITECLLITIAIIFLIRFLKPKPNFPPGPRGVPFFGNLLQLLNHPYLKHSQWARKYGKLHTVYLPNNINAVVINDLNLAKQMLCGPTFANRPEVDLVDMFSGYHGIIPGKQWDEMRRWSLAKLKEYGYGMQSMEGIIMDEIDEVVEYYKKNQGTPLLIKRRLNMASLNTIWTLFTGTRVSQEDEKIRTLMMDFDKIVPVLYGSGLLFAPWLGYIFPSIYKKVVAVADRIMDHCREAVDYHLDTYVEGRARGFIDEFIKEIKSTTNPSSGFYKEQGRLNLDSVVCDLIQGMTLTTGNTIVWTISYLTHYPELQRNVQEELDRVIGQRPVSLSDRGDLPYTEASIFEAMRYSSVVSTGLQQVAIEDAKVEGYTIPKGTWILTNIYWIHHDPKTWGDPENFRPERFLSEDKKKLVRNENLIPFKLGRRQCPGKPLATDLLFLFISTIFQRFEITKIEKEKPEADNSFVLSLKDQHFVFKSRA